MGESTKNKDELLVLNMIMVVALSKGINRLQVFGDLKMVIEWEKESFRMKNFAVIPLIDQIKQAAS